MFPRFSPVWPPRRWRDETPLRRAGHDEPRRNPVRFPRSESKEPSRKLNAASSSSSSCCDALLTLVHRKRVDPPSPSPSGMERPEELQPPEEGSGEKPPVMSPNVAVWKIRNTWRCGLIRVLPTILCERSSCEIITIPSRKCFKCAFLQFSGCFFLSSLAFPLLTRPPRLFPGFL